MPGKLNVPRFTSEADEAEWWFEHRDELGEAFEEAAKAGRVHRGTVARLARDRASAGPVPSATIHLQADDAFPYPYAGGEARHAV
jgi:hypothetical protein